MTATARSKPRTKCRSESRDRGTSADSNTTPRTAAPPAGKNWPEAPTRNQLRLGPLRGRRYAPLDGRDEFINPGMGNPRINRSAYLTRSLNSRECFYRLPRWSVVGRLGREVPATLPQGDCGEPLGGEGAPSVGGLLGAPAGEEGRCPQGRRGRGTGAGPRWR